MVTHVAVLSLASSTYRASKRVCAMFGQLHNRSYWMNKSWFDVSPLQVMYSVKMPALKSVIRADAFRGRPQSLQHISRPYVFRPLPLPFLSNSLMTLSFDAM
jgi:hypothetical protein